MKYLCRLILFFCYWQISALTPQLFECTASMQTVTIPAGVDRIYVDIQGAAAGSANGGTPGYGARVRSYLNVSPGTQLNIFVGCQGTLGNGGYNGGGNAVPNCGTYWITIPGMGSWEVPYFYAGGGGGASDIRIGGIELANRIIVAGGGGGNYFESGVSCSTTEKGGDAGENGYSGSCGCNGGGCSTFAGGGSAFSGGSGSSLASPGILGLGGRSIDCRSGGGGGGYYGGGGGGSLGVGGGGSSMSTGWDTIFTSGFRTGNGHIEITFLGSPTAQPTNQPTRVPSSQPSRRPSSRPSQFPAVHPTGQPTMQPTTRPSIQPTSHPSVQPSNQPSSLPSKIPQSRPSSYPSRCPSSQPSSCPSKQPTTVPSSQPTNCPSNHPSYQPTQQPKALPTSFPSTQPSFFPSSQPTGIPSSQPVLRPSTQPTVIPSSQPTNVPTNEPTFHPTSVPTNQPSSYPFSFPSSQPTVFPSLQPTSLPTYQPSERPTVQPTNAPTNQPSSSPSNSPSSQPAAVPSLQPTRLPTSFPSTQPSQQPTAEPSSLPTSQPTQSPFSFPTETPSRQPSSSPSNQPTVVPSVRPTSLPTVRPSFHPTVLPTTQPSNSPTRQPISFPTEQPSVSPTKQPTGSPSVLPTSFPSVQPTGLPSNDPTNFPTSFPTAQPSFQPTILPTSRPSNSPTSQPISFPTGQPSASPSCQPTFFPSSQPSNCPSIVPTDFPTVQPSETPSRIPSGWPSSIPSDFPSSQPSCMPSEQPVLSPTVRPTEQPSNKPTVQPFAFPTSAPAATIYQSNGVLFWPGSTTSSNETARNDATLLGSSYVLFGRNYKRQRKFPPIINLKSVASSEFVSEIVDGNGGITNDLATRSTTILGDINGDSFEDILIGYPLIARCSIYFGNGVDDFATIIAASVESFALIGDPYEGGGFLGWSSSRIGDLNGDGFDEIVVSAIHANLIYVIFGKTAFNKLVYVHQLTANEGFKIIGSSKESNFGVSVTLVHHFHKVGHGDIAIAAMKPHGGQNIIYILSGKTTFVSLKDILIDDISSNLTACFTIITPTFSFAGFSIAGIGDINSDGYYDLAIGSLPYHRGSYAEQRTYIVYGRKVTFSNELLLAEMTEKDGFIIIGGGFLVSGVGDVNSDGIADVMISSFSSWNGQRNAYLIITPKNMTYSPSLQPSSSPTMTVAISAGNYTIHDNSTVLVKPTFRPSHGLPTLFKPTLSPTRSAFAVGTARPSLGKLSVAPSLTPSSGYHHLRGFPTVGPIQSATRMPTINTTDYTTIVCPNVGDYQGNSGTNYKFLITVDSGTVQITGNDEGNAKNLYVLYCPSERVNVAIKNFRLSTDLISVAHLTEAGYSYPSLNEISYASKNGPLTLLFCAEEKLQLIFSSFHSFELREHNFIFSQSQEFDDNNRSNNETVLKKVQIGVVCGVFVFLFLIFFALSYEDYQEEKARLKHEVALLDSLKDSVETLHPDYGKDLENHQVQGNCASSFPALVVNIIVYQETMETNNRSSSASSSSSSPSSSCSTSSSGSFKIKSSSLSPWDKNHTIGSINSDDWEDALVPSDDENDRQQQQEKHALSVVAPSVDSVILPRETYQFKNHLSGGPSALAPSSSSSSFSSTEAEEFQYAFEVITAEKTEIQEESDNLKDDNIRSINSDEWQDALALSDEDDDELQWQNIKKNSAQ
jgi:hypothetical protein